MRGSCPACSPRAARSPSTAAARPKPRWRAKRAASAANSILRAHSASEDARERADDTRPELGSSARVSIPFQFLLQNSIALEFFLVYLMPREQRERAAAEITRMLERGELIHNVAETFDLDDIVAAHEAVEAGQAMGNIVVRIG